MNVVRKMQHSAKLPHYVFVYGTLKRGQPNSNYLMDQTFGRCQLLGTGCTQQNFPLIVATEWNLPFLLNSPGRGQKVYGEIYNVSDKCLENLDEFEGHPDFYVRDTIQIHLLTLAANGLISGKVGEIMECWTYVLKSFEPRMLEMEMLSSYDSSGAHNRPYLPESDTSDASNFEEALQKECNSVESTKQSVT